MADISKITLPNNEEYNLKDTTARSSILQKYTKPSTGIPMTDLADDVQASFNKANAAIPADDLAIVETSPTSINSLYHKGDYLIYNEKLYIATEEISLGTTLDSSSNGNIKSSIITDELYDISAPGEMRIFQYTTGGYISGSGNYVEFNLPIKIKPGINVSFNITNSSIIFTPSTKLVNLITSLTVASRSRTTLALEGRLSTTQTPNQMCTVTILDLIITGILA